MQRASAIFGRALELPEAERESWIADACGDDLTLRGEVLSLLAAHERAASKRSGDGWAGESPGDSAASSSSSSSGARIGPYLVRDEIGRGGMGVVYRAVDPRLHRDVALKLLSPGLTSNEKARQSLLEEARAASALDHPNICTIYDIGKSDDDSLYVAMAYYEGQTLAARIEQGALPAEEALQVAAGILRGLENAHANRVIHRDIKPSNVLITKRDEVKILDFGLAKRGVEENTDPDTQLGTLAYMSPEQVLGQPVDARTDLWSLGVTLYQMLVGKPPFAEPQEAALLYAIAHEEPEPLPESVPARARSVVEKLLAKDPNERYQSASELLGELAEETPSGARLAQTPPAAPAPPPQPRPRWGYWAAGLGCLALGGALFLPYSGGGDAAPELGEPAPFTSLPGREERPAFSPDGARVAFSWNGPEQDNYDIYVQAVGASSAQRLTEDPAWDSSPAWSPDGGSLAFLRALSDSQAQLWIRELDSGEERLVAGVHSGARFGLSWSADGAEIAVIDRVGPGLQPVVAVIDPATGGKRVIARPPGGAVEIRFPRHSPDGRTIAFEAVQGAWLGRTYLAPAAGGDVRELETGRGYPEGLTWLAGSGGLLYARSSLEAQRSLGLAFLGRGDGGKLPLSGNPSDPAVAPGGERLVFSQRVSKYDIVRLGLEEREGPALPFLSSTRFDGNPQYSPDGSRVLFSSSRSGAVEVWTGDADGSNARQLTALGVAGSPKWSPDGSRVAFDSTVEGVSNIYVVDAAGGEPVRLTDSPAADYVPTWSADGEWIYFASDRTGSPQIWKTPADGSSPPVIVMTGSGIYGIESPDGATLYYAKSRSRDTAIWRLDKRTGEDVPVVEGLSSGWSNWQLGPEGVYYVDDAPAEERVESWGVYLRRFGAARSELLARLPHAPTTGAPGFGLSPDGKYALVGLVTIESDLMIVDGDFR